METEVPVDVTIKRYNQSESCSPGGGAGWRGLRLLHIDINCLRHVERWDDAIKIDTSKIGTSQIGPPQVTTSHITILGDRREGERERDG